MTDTATKHDGGKPRLDLIAPEVMIALGTVLAFGAKKYAERNWEKGMSWGRVYGALQRHLQMWAMGIDLDEESGYPHLWHALTNLHFLVAYADREAGTDDRSKFIPLLDDEDDDGGGGKGSLVDCVGTIENNDNDAWNGVHWVDDHPVVPPVSWAWDPAEHRWLSRDEFLSRAYREMKQQHQRMGTA